jgi:hypothetical protein
MTIRTILAAISGGSASAGGIDLACRLAQRFKAHVEGFHVVVDPRAEFAATGEGFGLFPSAGLIETVMDEARAKAAETLALFNTALAAKTAPPKLFVIVFIERFSH